MGTHGNGLGANIVGQSANMPVSGLPAQSLDPPPQFLMPESPMRDAPIRRMTVPVTIGGKMRCSLRAGMKDIAISRREQMREVPTKRSVRTSKPQRVAKDLPRTFPYASGHASRVIVPSSAIVVGHVPSLYMALNIELAVLSVAKLVPTTVMSPVPI